MTTIDDLELGDKKARVEAFVKEAERQAEVTATAQAKLDFRAGVAGSRRPDLFDPSTTHISAYFETFEPFRAIMNSNGQHAVNTFLTYLDQKSRNTLITKGITRKSTWDSFRKAAIEALSSPREAVKARYEIKRAKQRVDETVDQFGERLFALGKLGFTVEERDAMDTILEDALTAGLIRDEIAIVLINKNDGDFKDYLEEAIKLDGSYQARSTLREEDSMRINVLKNEIAPTFQQAGSRNEGCARRRTEDPLFSQHAGGNENQTELHQMNFRQEPRPGYFMPEQGIPQGSVQHPREFMNNPNPLYMNQGYRNPQTHLAGIQCYKCYQFGHYATTCPLQAAGQRSNVNNRSGRDAGIVCHYCGIQGHRYRDCRKRKRDEGYAPARRDDERRWRPSNQYGPTESHFDRYRANESLTPIQPNMYYNSSNHAGPGEPSRNYGQSSSSPASGGLRQYSTYAGDQIGSTAPQRVREPETGAATALQSYRSEALNDSPTTHGQRISNQMIKRDSQAEASRYFSSAVPKN